MFVTPSTSTSLTLSSIIRRLTSFFTPKLFQINTNHVTSLLNLQTMLRGKQLGTLSHSARSFLFNGPRCNAADGNSCAGCDDETCMSKRPFRANTKYIKSSPNNSLPKDIPIRPNVNHFKPSSPFVPKPENVSLPQEIVPTRTTPRVSYSDNDKDTVHSSPPISDHFVKAGMAAVSLLSDLVNYRIPLTDGSKTSASPQNSVVDKTKPISYARNAKASRNGKVCGKPSAEAASAILLDKGVPSKDPGNYVDAPRDGKRSIPNKARGYSERFVARPVREVNVMSKCNVVDSVSRILQHSKWNPSSEESLRRLNFSLDAYQANQILKQIQDFNSALGFFYWLKRQPGFKHDGHTYTTMIGILGRAKQFGSINRLLLEMVNDGCQPNIVTYNRLIHSYGKANYLKDAIGVFNQMQKMGCEPDRVTYCTLIDIHAKAGFLDVAIDMYHRMQNAGISPDTFTYSVIINCLGKAGHLAAAHKLFCEMVSQGCVPNLVTFNIMIALQAKARNYQSALHLYRDMQNAGFQPDKVTYSIVMEVLGHSGYLEEAEAVFSEMKRKNWVPDEPVYGLLVDLWGKASNVEKAWEWYEAMLNAGLRPNVPTCNSLLSAFLRVHRLPDAYNLLQNMVDLGLSPSLQTYTLLLSTCTEAQTSFDLTFCGELMAITRHPAHSFLTSMPAPGPDGQNVRAHVSDFLDCMHSEDRESKRGLVDSVIDFFHKTGLKEEAGSVWEVALQKNVYPDALIEKSSCYWLINLHVMSDGTAVTALSRSLAWFRRELLFSGICPSRIDIVTGWGRRSRVKGTSLVRESVGELLSAFGFPFFTENGNSGCFVGCGPPLNRWLMESYVDRMHLL